MKIKTGCNIKSDQIKQFSSLPLQFSLFVVFVSRTQSAQSGPAVGTGAPTQTCWIWFYAVRPPASCSTGSAGPEWPLWPPHPLWRPPALPPPPPLPHLAVRGEKLHHKGRWRSHRSNQSPPLLKCSEPPRATRRWRYGRHLWSGLTRERERKGGRTGWRGRWRTGNKEEMKKRKRQDGEKDDWNETRMKK